MPELPEVEFARRQLQRAMRGARVARVITRRPNLRYPFPSDFASRIEGQLVTAVTRRAKYLLVALGSGDLVLMHLGMSGSFRVLRRGKAPAARGYYWGTAPLDQHDHVVFEMSNAAIVVFNDPRRFGFMTLLGAGKAVTHAALSRLGPEPLARTFAATALAGELRRRKAALKITLADQRVVAGLGNIYVSEALHVARLSPKRRASSLVTRTGEPTPALHDLVAAIRTVLTLAIQRQYRTGADDPFRVYDREGAPCPRVDCTGTIRRIVQGGRSTFFCPTCQK